MSICKDPNCKSRIVGIEKKIAELEKINQELEAQIEKLSKRRIIKLILIFKEDGKRLEDPCAKTVVIKSQIEKVLRVKRIIKLLLVIIVFSVCVASLSSTSRSLKNIHVQLFHNKSLPREILLSGRFEVIHPLNLAFPQGEYILKCANGQIHILTTTHKTLIASKQFEILAHPKLTLAFASINRSYPGRLKIAIVKHEQLKFENIVTPQDYVKIVVASETPANWPLEALKAQAVLTRTRLASYKPGKILHDSTQDEAYLGLERVTPLTEKAIRETVGNILMSKGSSQNNLQLTHAYYHASCGGRIGDEAYFRGLQSGIEHIVKCDLCRAAPFEKLHKSKIPKTKFQEVFGRNFPQILKKDISGRPLLILLSGNKQLTGYEFWLKLGQSFGWDKSPGTHFELYEEENFIVVSSRGVGHGVGLCQWGARKLALEGKTYKQILQFYFPQSFVK